MAWGYTHYLQPLKTFSSPLVYQFSCKIEKLPKEGGQTKVLNIVQKFSLVPDLIYSKNRGGKNEK